MGGCEASGVMSGVPAAGSSLPLATAGDDGQVVLSALQKSEVNALPISRVALCVCISPASLSMYKSARAWHAGSHWQLQRSVRPLGGAYAHGLAWGPSLSADGHSPLFVGAWDGSLSCSMIELGL